MKPSFFLKSALILMICIGSAMAQTPAADLDSITEDSYKRMLERQEAEQMSDSVMVLEAPTAIPEKELNESLQWNYRMVAIGLVVALFGLWSYTRITKKY